MLCLISSSVSSQILRRPSADLSPLLKAVNEHNLEAVKSFSSDFDPEDFDWLRHKKQNWQVDFLPVTHASSGKAFHIVFHSWHSCESDGDHLFYASVGSNGVRLGRQIPEEDTLRLRILDHNITAKIDVPTKIASFTDTLKAESGSGETGSSLFMRISQDYRLSALSLETNGKFAPVKFDQTGGIVAFIPPAKKKFTLRAVYSGKLINENGDYIHSDEAVINSYWYLHTARLPATLTVTATAPPGWTAIGQGEELLKKTSGKDGTSTVTYRNEIPTCFFTVDFGKYEIETRQVNGRTYSTYLLPNAKRNNAMTSKTSLDLLQKSMAFYEKNFAPFPYARYTIVETRGPFSGALEAYSFATFATGAFGAIPHELAHTWWGGTTPCDYIHSMWNEGFASYSDDLFQRVSEGAKRTFDPAKSDPKQRLEQSKRTVSGFGGLSLEKAYDTEDGKDATIGYGKGETILRILEEEIGQELMLKSMRRFYKDHKRGEIATWNEFEVAVNRTTEKDYRWFFEEWVERAGTPSVRLSEVALTKSGNDSFLEGDLVQSGEPYRMKLELGIEGGGGLKIETFEASGASTHFKIKVSNAPVRVWLDPHLIFPLGAAPSDKPDENPFVANLGGK